MQDYFEPLAQSTIYKHRFTTLRYLGWDCLGPWLPYCQQKSKRNFFLFSFQVPMTLGGGNTFTYFKGHTTLKGQIAHKYDFASLFVFVLFLSSCVSLNHKSVFFFLSFPCVDAYSVSFSPRMCLT